MPTDLEPQDKPKCEICNSPLWLSQGMFVEWKCPKEKHSENEWRAYVKGLKDAIRH